MLRTMFGNVEPAQLLMMCGTPSTRCWGRGGDDELGRRLELYQLDATQSADLGNAVVQCCRGEDVIVVNILTRPNLRLEGGAGMTTLDEIAGEWKRVDSNLSYDQWIDRYVDRLLAVARAAETGDIWIRVKREPSAIEGRDAILVNRTWFLQLRSALDALLREGRG